MKEITLFVLKSSNYDGNLIIKKQTFKIEKKDKLEIYSDGFVRITLVDAWQNGHNGDYENDYVGGHTTFENAKKYLLKKEKETYTKRIEYIKSMEEIE
jgi:hypothetical protein